MKIKVTEIIWVTDGEQAPSNTKIIELNDAPNNEDELEEAIADWLSDEFGWLTDGFFYEIIE